MLTHRTVVGDVVANDTEYYDIPFAARHYFPVRVNGQLILTLPSPLVRSVRPML